ncbi:MAG: heavy metal translocating P-type ATPase [Bdellovibrionales bacterium]
MKNDLKQKEWLFSVDGVHCVRCIRKIQLLSKDFPEIIKLKVDIGHKSLKTTAAESFRVESFISKVEAEGFGIKNIPLDQKEAYKKSESKKLLARLGVAGACAGNIMLLAAAEYSGADLTEWSNLFGWMGFALFLPVLFYSSMPFYLNSYYAIKNKKVSIDTPIAIAIVGGGLLSFYQLLQGSTEVYFDSISMFVFFLLGSRYFIFKLQSKYLSPVSLEDVYSKKKVDRLVDGSRENVDLKDVSKDDIIVVEQNGYLPVDGELYSESASVSDAFFSGEFFPKEKKKFDLVHAGSQNISKEILVKVLKPSSETRLSSIIDKLNISLNSKTEMSTLADEGAHYLTYAVLLLSVICLGIFSFTDLQEGIDRVLALLVVACPCGLAIATPLVQSLGVKLALKNSLLVKNASVFEKIGKVNKVIFDKTGTLTQGNVQALKWIPREPSAKEKMIIYNLERVSEHPIARALIKSVGAHVLEGNFESHHEEIGKGVSALYQGNKYEIKSLKGTGENAVAFYKDGEESLRVILGDEISKGSSCVVESMKGVGLEPFLLSGDQKFNAFKVGQSLGMDTHNIYGEMTPEQKVGFIENLKDGVLYVGDGVNDSLAMSKSLISVSMDSAADVAYKSSDVHILSGGIQRIIYLVELSKRALSSIKWIFVISLVYNISFAVIALLGFITPLWAVLIMPISSITITLFGFYMMLEKKSEAL